MAREPECGLPRLGGCLGQLPSVARGPLPAPWPVLPPPPAPPAPVLPTTGLKLCLDMGQCDPITSFLLLFLDCPVPYICK